MIFWTRLFVNILLLLLLWFIGQQPSWALEANVLQRTAICPKASINCLPLFFLNMGESVQVLGASPDKNWFRVEYGNHQLTGWIWAKDLKIRRPLALDKTLFPLQQPNGNGCFLSFEQSRMVLINSDHTALLQLQFPDQWSHRALNVPRNETSTCLGGSQQTNTITLFQMYRVEKETFIGLIRAKDQQPLEYHSLFRLISPDSAVYMSMKPTYRILAPGTGPWGYSLLLSLDTNFVPDFLLRKQESFFFLLPTELQVQIVEGSLTPLALDPQGYIYLIGLEKSSRKPLLLKLFPTAQSTWQYVASLEWPFPIGETWNKPMPGIKVATLGSETYLAFSERDNQAQSYILYYAATGDLLYREAIDNLVDLAVDDQAHLWTLHPDQLLKWQPRFTELPDEEKN